jgi:hypothetical protein
MPKSNLHFKASSVLRAVKAASKAELVVTGFEIEPDGTIRVLAAPSGKKSHDTSSELDKWLGEHPDAGQTQGH